jgi:hypothetical protein
VNLRKVALYLEYIAFLLRGGGEAERQTKEEEDKGNT